MSKVNKSDKEVVYYTLPRHLVDQSKSLIGLDEPPEELSRKQQLKSFLEATVPECDRREVSEEVRKGYPTNRVKYVKKKFNKRQPTEKCAISRQLSTNRGKKKLSGIEKRELGLNFLEREKMTFDGALPINDLWQGYARELLGLKCSDSHKGKFSKETLPMTAIQLKIRKIEYFGCYLRVTRSLCPEYIGITGIVVRDTKNTFVLVTCDNRVVTVPKSHNEFSFVVDNLGFSVMGNHLIQRPADRSSHSVKKHSLWL